MSDGSDRSGIGPRLHLEVDLEQAMVVKAGNWFTATIVPSAMLPYPPRFYLNPPSVRVGPYQNAEEYEEYFYNQTEGIGDPELRELDEYRFDPDTRLLRGLNWISSDEPIESLAGILAWEEATVQVGLLRLETQSPLGVTTLIATNEVVAHFTSTRWVDPRGTSYAALNAELLRSASMVVRLQVAQDLYLLIADEHIAGWVLLNPATYLTDLWEGLPGTGDEELGVILAEYLALACYPSLDDMDPDNAESFQQLVSLYERLGGISGDVGHRQVLRLYIDDLASRFFLKTVSGGPYPQKL